MMHRLYPSLIAFAIAAGTFAQKAPDLRALDAYITNAVKQFDQPGLAVGIVHGNGGLLT